METFLIKVPENKTALVKRLLKELGVAVKRESDPLSLAKKKPVTIKKKPSDFFGSISEKEGKKLHTYVNESREEWQRDI